MNQSVSAGRRVSSARRVCALAVVSFWVLAGGPTAAVAAAADADDSQTVDLSPLLELPIDLSNGLVRAFPDWELLVVRGVQQSNRKERKDGVLELVKKSYDSELDEASRWVVDVSLTLFDSPARAARDLDSACYSQAHGGASSTVRWRNGVYCISSMLHLHNDPRSLHLPTDTYFSWVLVRRDALVVRVYERHKGSPRTAKNQIIREVADRLSNPASAGH